MLELFHSKRDVIAKLTMVSQEIIPSMRDDLLKFSAHIINERGDGIFNVIALPFHSGMDIHVPLLMQETVGSFYAVFRQHTFMIAVHLPSVL